MKLNIYDFVGLSSFVKCFKNIKANVSYINIMMHIQFIMWAIKSLSFLLTLNKLVHVKSVKTNLCPEEGGTNFCR